MRGGSCYYPDRPRLWAAYYELWHEVFGAEVIRAAPRPLTPFITILPEKETRLDHTESSEAAEADPYRSVTEQAFRADQETEAARHQGMAAQRAAADSLDKSADSHDRVAKSYERLVEHGVSRHKHLEHAAQHHKYAQEDRRMAQQLRQMAESDLVGRRRPLPSSGQ